MNAEKAQGDEAGLKLVHRLTDQNDLFGEHQPNEVAFGLAVKQFSDRDAVQDLIGAYEEVVGGFG